jgi:hypothetical protein
MAFESFACRGTRGRVLQITGYYKLRRKRLTRTEVAVDAAQINRAA